MPTINPLKKCGVCEKDDKLRLKVRTLNKSLEVWLCPKCDGRAMDFCDVELVEPEENE